MARNVKLEGWWDKQDPENAGWYVRVVDEETGDIIDDSEKVWFGVDVNEYGAADGRLLAAVLATEYPGAVSISID